MNSLIKVDRPLLYDRPNLTRALQQIYLEPIVRVEDDVILLVQSLYDLGSRVLFIVNTKADAFLWMSRDDRPHQFVLDETETPGENVLVYTLNQRLPHGFDVVVLDIPDTSQFLSLWNQNGQPRPRIIIPTYPMGQVWNIPSENLQEDTLRMVNEFILSGQVSRMIIYTYHPSEIYSKGNVSTVTPEDESFDYDAMIYMIHPSVRQVPGSRGDYSHVIVSGSLAIRQQMGNGFPVHTIVCHIDNNEPNEIIPIYNLFPVDSLELVQGESLFPFQVVKTMMEYHGVNGYLVYSLKNNMETTSDYRARLLAEREKFGKLGGRSDVDVLINIWNKMVRDDPEDILSWAEKNHLDGRKLSRVKDLLGGSGEPLDRESIMKIIRPILIGFRKSKILRREDPYWVSEDEERYFVDSIYSINTLSSNPPHRLVSILDSEDLGMVGNDVRQVYIAMDLAG